MALIHQFIGLPYNNILLIYNIVNCQRHYVKIFTESVNKINV